MNILEGILKDMMGARAPENPKCICLNCVLRRKMKLMQADDSVTRGQMKEFDNLADHALEAYKAFQSFGESFNREGVEEETRKVSDFVESNGHPELASFIRMMADLGKNAKPLWSAMNKRCDDALAEQEQRPPKCDDEPAKPAQQEVKPTESK